MKNISKKLISATLAATMVSSLWGMGVMAEDIAVSTVTPANNASAVSVVKDISLNFNTELDDALLTTENFAVTSTGNVPKYEIEKSGNTVKLNFDSEFDYDTDYTLTLKNVGEEKSFKFTTEQDPVNVLFEEDFSTLTDLSEKFTNTGAGKSQYGGTYGIDSNGKTLKIGGCWNKNVGGGVIATVKGSESWVDYEVYGEFKQRTETLGIIGLRQTVDTTTADNQTNDGYFVSAGSYYTSFTDSTGMTLGLTKAKTNYGTPCFTTAADTPAVEDETFYGVNVSVIGNTINASTKNLKTGDVMNSFSYTDTDKTYKKGALGFGALNTFTYWDNIKVVDKGLMFTADKVKNTGSTITLTFNEAIDEDSVSDGSVTIKKNGEAVASAVEVVNNKTIKAAILQPELDTEYAITVSKDIKRASDGMGMSNDKTFNILTSENEDDVEIPTITVPIVLEKVTPADGAEAVSVFADPVISFQTELDENTLSGKIAVTRTNGGKVPGFTVVKDGKNAVVKFEKELDYETTYNVVVNTGIKNVYGGELSQGKKFSFTTERNEMDVLFEEDFSTLTDLSQRFTNTGDQTQHRYSIEGNALIIGEHHEWAIGQGPIATIKGSENWSDYEVYAEFKTREYASGVIAFRQQVNTSTASDQTEKGYFLRAGGYDGIYVNGERTESNQMHLDLNAFDSNMTPYVYTDTYPEITDETYYGVTLNVEGNKIDAHTTDLATGKTLNTLSYTDTKNQYMKGAVGFGVYYGWTYWDNIKVMDKGFRFTPYQMKNVEGAFSIDFTDDVNKETLAENIVVTDKDGKTMKTRVTLNGTKKVDVVIVGAENEKEYNVTVKQAVASVNGKTMANDKTFSVTVKLPFEIEELYVADTNGKATSLTAEGKVKGIAKISHLEDKHDYTIVIAVYDETGAMYDVLFKEKNVSEAGTFTLETEEIKLPKDITGYKASVFLMDNLNNIKPLTGKVSIPN